MNDGVKYRLNAIGDCCNGIGNGVATLLFNIIRLPFAIVFGWPDPMEHAMAMQRMLTSQVADLEAKSEAQARENAPPKPSSN